jgi:hypothetical protein
VVGLAHHLSPSLVPDDVAGAWSAWLEEAATRKRLAHLVASSATKLRSPLLAGAFAVWARVSAVVRFSVAPAEAPPTRLTKQKSAPRVDSPVQDEVPASAVGELYAQLCGALSKCCGGLVAEAQVLAEVTKATVRAAHLDGT